MASFAKGFDNLKTLVYNKYSENPAKLLVFAGTLGWALSSLAQVGAIVFNEKLTSKDRKFLIPQEIADGAVNVGLFFAITSLTHHLANNVIETGKIMFKEIKAPLQNVLQQKNMTLEQALKANKNKISNILTNEADIKNFVKLKGGATLAAALLGSIVSCNILTPLIRNFIGAKWQKKLTSKSAKLEITPTQMPATAIASQPIKKSNTLNNVYNNFYTNSSMKI